MSTRLLTGTQLRHETAAGSEAKVPLTPHTPGHAAEEDSPSEEVGQGLLAVTPAKTALHFDAGSCPAKGETSFTHLLKALTVMIVVILVLCIIMHSGISIACHGRARLTAMFTVCNDSVALTFEVKLFCEEGVTLKTRPDFTFCSSQLSCSTALQAD